MKQNLEALLEQMTLEEKIGLLAGADMWQTVPLPRLGIPAIKTTDGPMGARGADEPSGPTSACFPCGTALAATWNPELVERVGAALAEETRLKGAHILLAPTVNIHRSPLGGRNFECYSEDPYLTARMAVAYINGLQGGGVGACLKHFVCNDSEFERFSMNSQVGERALREIYLRPFEIALREAGPWAVMSSYNRLNGIYANENPHLLLDILKREWGFDGLVISDWYGTYSKHAVRGGLDLEMPGPARWMGKPALAAVQSGEVSESAIDDKVRRLLRTIQRVGAFDHPEPSAEEGINRPEHGRLALEAASEAIVLLKNSPALLPLDVDKVRSIAVIGANARWPSFQGGGSVRVHPHYVVSPLEALRDKAGDRVRYAAGCAIHQQPRRFERDWLIDPLRVDYFPNLELQGEPVYTEMSRKANLVWYGDVLPHFDPATFSVRVTGTFAVPESGTFDLYLGAEGRCRLALDGKEIINLWDPSRSASEQVLEVELTAGHPYRLEMQYASEPDSHWRSLHLGCMPHLPEDSIEQAAALAAESEIAIVFAGLTDEWESEGFDRPDMELPGEQLRLIEAVSAANPNTIVVLNAGAPVDMSWLEQVPAVLQAWYLGQETGSAIADVLFGDANPSGKLPSTFPRRLQDNPAYLNYPGENGEVQYGEGIFAGYRYYDKKGITPLFPFGYGLSYTTFAYRGLALNAADYGTGDEIQLKVEVENTGARAGKEIVQVYVRDPQSRLVRPEKELKAFAKVSLEPGECKTLTFSLDQGALSYYDPAYQAWVAEPGEFELLVGSSSRDLRLSARFKLR